MKRYSIVRVDGECPKGFNEDIYCKWCGNCGRIYGDTKEQLIKKVAQALTGTLWNDRKGLTYEEIAKKIVEFLGVK